MLSPKANLPLMKQNARKFSAKYGWRYETKVSEQVKCGDCFAIDNESIQAKLVEPTVFYKPRPRYFCCLDGHKVIQPFQESCPLGRRPL